MRRHLINESLFPGRSLKHHGGPSTTRLCVWSNCLKFNTCGLFFLFSFSLSPSWFLCWPSKCSKQPFNFIFLKIQSVFFRLLFVLFGIIYEIVFFNFIPHVFFSSVRFDPYFFNCYLFYLKWFLKLFFFFTLSSFFFPYQILLFF
jgi:hypothetical protein